MGKLDIKSFSKKLLSRDFVLNGSFWIVLSIGLIAFGFGIYSYYIDDDFWAKVCMSIAQAMCISVLFTIISKSSYFVSILSDILEEIVYSTGHIENRSDKKEIWYRVTECLFKDKVPGLHKEISETIENTYIPKSDICYYH